MHITFGAFQLDVNGWLILGLITLTILVTLSARSARKRKPQWDGRGREIISYSPGEELDLSGPTIAVVDVRGAIITSASTASPLVARNATLGIETAAMLRELAENDDVKGVLVRFSTPGGTVVGSEELGDGLTALSAKKPVVAYVEDMSASGGVFAMVGATETFAHPSALIGSIGVIGPTLKHYENVTGLGQGLFGEHVTAKVSAHVLYAGKGKAFGNPFVNDDHHSRDAFQALLNESYARFQDRVSRYRQVPLKTLQDLGAHIVSAAFAKSIRLIDDIGSEHDALTRLFALAKVDANKVETVALKMQTFKKVPFLEMVSGVRTMQTVDAQIASILHREPMLACAAQALRAYGFLV